jgi:hypothetical protein
VPTITFHNLPALRIAAALALATVAIALLRRAKLPRPTLAAIAAGLLALALAAGEPAWRRPLPEPVRVMVDLSPSTRTAAYRERAALEKRVGELLGDTPYRLTFFARGPGAANAAAARLPDLAADRTVFTPPAAPAVVLFSDGRFPPPAVAPPTFVVVDPNLDEARDAAVTGLDVRAADVAIATANAGAPRGLRVTGAAGDADFTAPAGTVVFTQAVPPSVSAGPVTARVTPGDAWPENDVLSAFVPPPPAAQRWWAGAAPPDGSWRAVAPAELPTDPSAYLAPSIVVLDNVPATALSEVQQQRLQQYVRDLGGGLLILGGDRAFAAGDYAGSLLEQLSPLASTPPEPTNRWLLLVDSSGSMNQPAPGGRTRWRYAVEAVGRVLPALPPDDLIGVGGFAREVTWWVRDTTARTAAAAPIPPPGAGPRGPTELRAALLDAARSADGALPTQLLLMTDANADLGDAAELSRALSTNRVRLHLLLIGEGSDGRAEAIRTVVQKTGGSLLAEADPQKWVEAARALVRAARPNLLEQAPADVRFLGEASALPARRVAARNRTWLKSGGVALAEATPAAERVAAAARRGDDDRVIAAAFAPTAAELAAFARLAERPPRDPRFRVAWETHPRLRVTVDAAGADQYLNGVRLTLKLLDEQGEARFTPAALAQVAPGRYQIELDPPARPLLAVLEGPGGVAIGRAAIAGRYPPEFDAIGNDRRAMRELANRTGGSVVETSDRGPLRLPRPRRDVPLTSWLATIGAAFVATGMIAWRLT